MQEIVDIVCAIPTDKWSSKPFTGFYALLNGIEFNIWSTSIKNYIILSTTSPEKLSYDSEHYPAVKTKWEQLCACNQVADVKDIGVITLEKIKS